MRQSRLVSYSLLCAALLATLLGCSPASQSAAEKALSDLPAFDGDRSYDLLKKQVALGTREPGSPGHAACAQFIESQLKPYADGVTAQRFSVTAEGTKLDLTNIAAHFNPSAKKWVLLVAHWDTRPRADYEINPEKRKQPIPGANDGASGTAVLLELARLLKEHKPRIGVYMLFVDGEDYGTSDKAMYLGAKHFAANLEKLAMVDGRPVKFEYGILLDMVGDKNLRVYQEQNSVKAAKHVVDKVWKAAAALGYTRNFPPEQKYAITDDHVPLIAAGIDCIDVIDFDYGPWHTLDDTPDKCSPKSLKIVGDVVQYVIYTEDPT